MNYAINDEIRFASLIALINTWNWRNGQCKACAYARKEPSSAESGLSGVDTSAA